MVKKLVSKMVGRKKQDKGSFDDLDDYTPSNGVGEQFKEMLSNAAMGKQPVEQITRIEIHHSHKQAALIQFILMNIKPIMKTKERSMEEDEHHQEANTIDAEDIRRLNRNLEIAYSSGMLGMPMPKTKK